MYHRHDADVALAETRACIKGIISREEMKVQWQASKLSMRFKSTTRWELLNYPLVIPDSVRSCLAPTDWIFPKLNHLIDQINLASPLEQDSALANLPKEILLAIFAEVEDDAFKSGSFTMSCKMICQAALLAKPSKTHKLLETLSWQRRDFKWCSGCGYNRPFDREYWNENKNHCHAWSDLRNDTHQFSSGQARYEDHEIDVSIWIEGWCSNTSASAGTAKKRNREDQWCPPCRAQWNWEISVVEAALLFDMEFRNLKEQEWLLKMNWCGESVQASMRESTRESTI
jgi:hypothetical protein